MQARQPAVGPAGPAPTAPGPANPSISTGPAQTAPYSINNQPGVVRVIAVPFGYAAPGSNVDPFQRHQLPPQYQQQQQPQLFFYPLPRPVDDADLNQGRIMGYVRRKYNEYSKAEPGSWRAKLYNWARGHVEDREPVDTFLHRLPSGTKQLEILYPSSLDPGYVAASLRSQVGPAESSSVKRLVITALLLPVAVVIDILTIGFLLTLCDAVAVGLSWHSWRTSRNVMNLTDPKHNRNQQQANPVSYGQSSLLESFYQQAQASPVPGVPSDADIIALARALKMGPLEEYFVYQVQQVRDRQLRLNHIKYPIPGIHSASTAASVNAIPNRPTALASTSAPSQTTAYYLYPAAAAGAGAATMAQQPTVRYSPGAAPVVYPASNLGYSPISPNSSYWPASASSQKVIGYDNNSKQLVSWSVAGSKSPGPQSGYSTSQIRNRPSFSAPLGYAYAA